MPSHRELANAIRALAMDAVQRANSGHPGMPMGMADIAQALWSDYLRFNPKNPNWFNRDRFVMSNGHGAMLQYALLHLTGFDLSMDDVKNFRQLHSKTPGHPEFADTPGVEMTTGPLGQGLASAVGMAIAEKNLATTFNREGHDIVNHYTYVFAGDGCLMEGISHEACSLAGTMGLGKLIVFYDDNEISIDGHVSEWFTDDTPHRFESYGWHVIRDVDGHQGDAIRRSIEEARARTDKPTLICCKTTIGFGAPNLAGTAKSHGSPLGEAEITAAKQQLNWHHPAFEIPDDIYKAWDKTTVGEEAELRWNQAFAKYEMAYPELAKAFLRRMGHFLPEQWQNEATRFLNETRSFEKEEATRKSSLQCIEHFSPLLPELLGGSADLGGSNCTEWSGHQPINTAHPGGNYIKYGVREFAMSAIANGLALHGGFIPFVGTFLVFSDYARNAVRLSALMQQKVIYVYTHDSIGLGEDGPTHQPIEHVSSLRMMPGLNVWRPCDRFETAAAWVHAISHQGPSALCLSRQNLAQQPHQEKDIEAIKRGGYVLFDADAEFEAIIMATGSEVALAMQAANALQQDGVYVRVVSMPCCDLFKEQDAAYRESVLPSHIPVRLAVEAGVPDFWHQFVGDRGHIMGIAGFGLSAPANQVYEEFGLTAQSISQMILSMLQKQHVEQKM